ncbi:hypothetical protein DFH07DRAFT_1066112 [Mycena maculata]|uniref:Uncharacterized protein n=1 Tax=Mycena maculata TaxID=230809 RepID=A0AAD7HWG7_9AGAR|nr:hypothetical protein DFH07DRAFT_1066112 [Mycena maculata]
MGPSRTTTILDLETFLRAQATTAEGRNLTLIRDTFRTKPQALVHHQISHGRTAASSPRVGASPARPPRLQRSVSETLPTIHDFPDPAFYNQYSDIGVQPHPHGPHQIPSHPIPDIGTMFSSLTLRQNQLDNQLAEQNRVLAELNSELKARLASIEAQRVPAVQLAPSTATAAARGGKGSGRGRQRGVRSTRGADSASPSEPSTHAIVLPSLGEPAKLSEIQKQVRIRVKRYVSNKFRTVCGVTKTDVWPEPGIPRVNEVTGEVFLTPYFDEACWPEGLADRGATWDIDVFKKIAGESFDGFKRKWRDAHNAARQARALELQQTNRQRSRRIVTKAVIEAYSPTHGLDPQAVKDIMDEQHMSDEVLGPEDESQESFANWRKRMAAISGCGDLRGDALAKLQFLEVLEPDWRSTEFSTRAVDVHTLWYDSLTAKEKSNIKYIRVRGTGQSSSRIPTKAPFNFGISKPWLEKHQFDPRFQDLLADWGHWPDPAGFGSVSDDVSDTGPMTGGGSTHLMSDIPIDPRFNFNFTEDASAVSIE